MQNISQAVELGSRFTVNFEKRTLRLDGKLVSLDDVNVLPLNGSVMLREIEGYYQQYKHSIPSERSESHRRSYFKALPEKDLSLKQGCSVASWLADVVLYHIDERLSRLRGVYCRYSDDAIFVGEDWQEAKRIMEEELAKMQMKLNPKKVEFLDADHWFKFLGFSIKGSSISLSSTRIKTFQKEIEKRTVKKRDVTLQKAINSVNRYLYKGYEGHSWSTQVLPIINAEEDVQTLNTFVMDCLRAVKTGKRKIGGIGFVKNQQVGCIQRGRGRNVTANRSKTSPLITGYLTLGCARKALLTSKAAYDTLVANL